MCVVSAWRSWMEPNGRIQEMIYGIFWRSWFDVCRCTYNSHSWQSQGRSEPSTKPPSFLSLLLNSTKHEESYFCTLLAHPLDLHRLACCDDSLGYLDRSPALWSMLWVYQGLQRLFWTICYLAKGSWKCHFQLSVQLSITLNGTKDANKQASPTCILFDAVQHQMTYTDFSTCSWEILHWKEFGEHSRM